MIRPKADILPDTFLKYFAVRGVFAPRTIVLLPAGDMRPGFSEAIRTTY